MKGHRASIGMEVDGVRSFRKQDGAMLSWLIVLTLAPCTVSYTAACAAPVVLESDAVRVELSLKPLAIVRLEDRRSGRSFIERTQAAPLLSVDVHRPGAPKAETLEAADAHGEFKRAGAAPVWIGRLAWLDGKLAATCRLALEGRFLRASCNVENRSELDVVRVEFPALGGLRAAERCEDDRLTWPHNKGELIANPSQHYRSIVSWPGNGSMAWCDLADRAGGGLYLASYDSTAKSTVRVMRPDRENGRIALSFAKHVLIRPGEKWESQPYVMALHDGDWHWAADRYRAWARTWLRPPENPRWFDSCDHIVMTHTSNRAQSAFDRLPDQYQVVAGERKGGGVFWIQAWDVDPGSFGPPYPCPLYGTCEQFENAMWQVKKLGGEPMVYFDHRVWDIGSDGTDHYNWVPKALCPPDAIYPADFGAKHCVRDIGGGPHVYTEGRRKFVTMCAMDPGWQKFLEYWCTRHVRDFGCTGDYLDELSCGPAYVCHSRQHGHEGIGDWGPALAETVHRIVREGRSFDPRYFVTGEAVCDVYGQYANLHAVQGPGTNPEIFHYTFPEYVLAVRHRGEGTVPPRMQVNNIFISGLRFWDLPGGRYGLRVLALRRRLRSFLYKAVFRDTVGVKVSDERVQARLHLRVDDYNRAAMVTISNLERVAGSHVTVDTSSFGPVKAAWLATLDGGFAALSGQASARSYAFRVPEEPVCAAILVNRSEPLLEMGVPNVVAGQTAVAAGTLRNLNAEPLSGTFTVAGPHVSCARLAFGPVAPGASAALECEVEVAADANLGVYDLECRVEAGPLRADRYARLCVVEPVQPELHVLTDGRLRLILTNATGEELEAAYEIEAEPPLSVPQPSGTVRLAGAQRRLMVMPLHGINRLDLPVNIRATVTALGRTAKAFRRLRGPLLNGDFELDEHGNGLPDYWNYAIPSWGVVALDREVVRVGKASLRMEPAPESRRNCLMSTFVMLKPGTRYRLSGWIRRSANSFGIWAGLVTESDYEHPQAIGRLTDAPLNAWQHFETTVESRPGGDRMYHDCVYQFYLANFASDATVWFDGLKLEEIGPVWAEE